MSDQYTIRRCDICHQSTSDDSHMILAKCQHRYHRQCLSLCDKTNNSKCPVCANGNQPLSTIPKEKVDEEDNYSEKTIMRSISTASTSATLNNSSEPWSCDVCTYINLPNLTECEICRSPRSTNSNENNQLVKKSNDHHNTSESSPRSFLPYTTNSSFLSQSTSTFDQLPQCQDQISLQWECEMCTYENRSDANLCSMCNEGKRPYTMTQLVSQRTFQELQHSEGNLVPISSTEDKILRAPLVTSKSEQKLIVFIPHLPCQLTNTELEDMIRLRLSNHHHVHVADVRCYSNISVGIVNVVNETDRDCLVKHLQSIILDPQRNTIIQFVQSLELNSYVVVDQTKKIMPTPDDVAHQLQQICHLSRLPTCEIVAIQFPNIFKIISRSLDDLLDLQSIHPMAIKDQFIGIYFNADCSFFEDLPHNASASQITVAINAQIGGQFDQSSLYVQYNKDAANAIVLAASAAHKWSDIQCITLQNQHYMKKKRLPFRLVVHSVPLEIPNDLVIRHQQFQNAVTHTTRVGNKLILEIKDKSVYDKCLADGLLHIRDHYVLLERYTPITNDPENMEINAETWYETQMSEYEPDLKQFLDNPQHPIFKYQWNAQSWSEQFQHHEGVRHDENDKQRRLLRVTVMLNTIGVLLKKQYTLEINNNKKEIKLNLQRMKNIIYNHRSKLVNSKEISTSLSTPCPSTVVKVVNEDCLAVYERLARENNHPVLLNMANAYTPGGGYRKGAGAQEENLFRRSNYYLSLDMELDYNKQADRFWCTETCEYKPVDNSQKIYPIDEYGAIYTSGITVFRHSEDKGYAYLEQPLYGVCSIALAAYAKPELKHNDNNTLADKFAVNTRKKIENLFAIAHHHGHDCLVLSAFGCGAFRNPPSHIAKIFKTVIEQYAGYFKTIYFSIIDDHNTGNRLNPDGNYLPFKTILDNIDVQPAKHELDVNMISGPFRVIKKDQQKLTIDHVKILDLPPCKFASLCHDLNYIQHCQSYSHPPLCPCYQTCNQSSNGEVHLSSFIHRSKCSYGGTCKLMEDDKHLRLYDHPEFCNDRGFCSNMDKSHLMKFRHVNLCKDGLKCLTYLKNITDHCRSYRHCQSDCPYGRYCIHFHDQEHINDQAHPFAKPCPLTPYVCKYHIEYLQAKKDKSSKISREVEEHCIHFSHICPFGRQCQEKNDLHIRTSIHIARNLCSDFDHCSKTTNEEHLNSFTHIDINDIRFVCKYSNVECHDRRDHKHILHYRHTGNYNHTGIVRYSGLNKNINFVRNHNELIKIIRTYTESHKWTPAKDTVDDITEWIRALQPVHRCNRIIFESILVHGHVMSRKYMDNLRHAQFVANAVDQHPKVRKIFRQYNNTVLQGYAADFIRALVAIEFDKAVPKSTSLNPSVGVAAALHHHHHHPYANDEQMKIVRFKESLLKSYLKLDEINMIRKLACRIADASLKLHANPLGIGHSPDELFGTNNHVFSILGPNLGYYYGDIVIVFKHELMFHPDANFSIQAATTYGHSGNAYKDRPWLKDPGPIKERVQYFHGTKLHCSIPGYEHAAAMELMALTGLKNKTMNVKLKHVQDRWISIDPHGVFESHLPQLIPLDYIDHVYIPKNVFYSLSASAQTAAKETFRHSITITDHTVDLNITQQLDSTRRPYEKYVHEEVLKTISKNNFRFHRGTIITIPASSFEQYICIPMTISQSFHQYSTNNVKSDTIYIYWQALGGDMMLTITKYQIDASRDQNHNPCVMCYISDISLNDNIKDYRESDSYITNNHPYSHKMLVQNGSFKAKSNSFHRGCNIYDYITYCLTIKRRTGEITLTHAGANSIYNHEKISYTFQRSDIDLPSLDYVQVSGNNRVVPLRNLVIRHEPIKEYHPSFDQNFKEGSEPLPASSKQAATTASASYISSKDDRKEKEEGQSVWSYVKDKVLGKDENEPIPCRDSVNCLLQYSSEASKLHNKKYSHPCRFAELCRSISDHPYFEHTPRSVTFCSYDKRCRDLALPIHRAQYRHTNLPDFLYPCRYQKQCQDKTNEHRIRYSHGEKIPPSLVTGTSTYTSSSSSQLQSYTNDGSKDTYRNNNNNKDGSTLSKYPT